MHSTNQQNQKTRETPVAPSTKETKVFDCGMNQRHISVAVPKETLITCEQVPSQKMMKKD